MVLVRKLPRRPHLVAAADLYLSNRPLNNSGRLQQISRVSGVSIFSTGLSADRPFAVASGDATGRSVYGRFVSANKVEIGLRKGRFDVSRDFARSLPGWFGAVSELAPAGVILEDGGSLLLDCDPVRLNTPEWLLADGPTKVILSYRPFSFRLGLFLMCIGIAALSCVGVYHSLKQAPAKQ